MAPTGSFPCGSSAAAHQDGRYQTVHDIKPSTTAKRLLTEAAKDAGKCEELKVVMGHYDNTFNLNYMHYVGLKVHLFNAS